MKVYKSSLPPIAIPEISIASFLYPLSDPLSMSSPAFIDADSGRSITRGQMRILSAEFAWGMRNGLSKLGGVELDRGDTVLIFSSNCLAYPIAMHGCFLAGLRLTLANSSFTSTELANQLQDSNAKVVLVHPTLHKTILSMFSNLDIDVNEAKRRIIIMEYDTNAPAVPGFMHMAHLLGCGQLVCEEQLDAASSRETALICYSSGTSGKPKGVELTHRNLIATSLLFSQVNSVAHGKDITLGFLPFYHIYGAVLLLQFFFKKGVPIVIMERFDPLEFLRNMERFKITYATMVPPILVILARHPAVANFDLTSLHTLMCGAAPLSASLQEAVQRRLDTLGVKVKIFQGYGLTEATPVTYFYDTQHSDRKIGAVGKLLSGMEARLVVDDGATDAGEGKHGELWIRGPIVMKGYLNNTSATRDAITDDGWFKSGDIATIDKEGYFRIVDRQKELIKYNGFQVPPAELEGILLEHPHIADVGVVGVQYDADATELPRAFVVHSIGLRSDKDKQAFAKHIQEWVKGRVAKQKYLRGGVVVVDAIPKSPSGKILRRVLRERANRDLEKTISAHLLSAKL